MDKSEMLLQELYKNTTMGADSLIDLMDRAGDPHMRAEMTGELDKYKAFSKKAASLLAERGLKPEEPGLAAKAGAKLGMAFNTMLDTTTSHIAEMMINGAVMGIVNIEKQLNEMGTPSTPAEKEACALAQDILKYEKATADHLGRFL